jgi:cobaltochelatase CobN
MEGKNARVDCVIVNIGFSQVSLSNPGDGSVRTGLHNFFEDLNVPVLQTMTMWKTREEWERSTHGLEAIEISTNVVWPEYDGQIITVPLGCMATDDDGVRRFVPIPDRVRRVASWPRHGPI